MHRITRDAATASARPGARPIVYVHRPLLGEACRGGEVGGERALRGSGAASCLACPGLLGEREAERARLPCQAWPEPL
jgi:hypothetical protein